MDLSSINLYRPGDSFFESIYTFGLHNIPWQRVPNFNYVLCEKVLPLFCFKPAAWSFHWVLSIVSREILINHFLFTFSTASTILQTSITSLIYTHPHSSLLLFSLCSWLFVALQYPLWKPNSMQSLRYRCILHVSSSTIEVSHSLLLLLFLLCLFLHR